MRGSRLVLILMAAAVVLLIGGALAVRAMGGFSFGGGNRPVIAIVTDSTVFGAISTAEKDSLRQAAEREAADAARQANERSGTSAGAEASSNEGGGDVVRTGETARTVMQVLTSQLDNQLSDQLGGSQRFRVISGALVQQALRERARRDNSGSALDSLRRLIHGEDDENAEAPRTSDADLAALGRDLNAQYVLFVGTQEPTYTVRRVSDEITGQRVYEFHAQPTFVFSLFNVRTGESVRSGVIRFSEPLIARDEPESYGEVQVREENNTEARREAVQGNMFDRPSMQALAFEMNAEIARQVRAAVLNRLAPARIVGDGDAPRINRGAKDGVTAGMEMDVYQISGPVMEDGVEIDPDREHVGRVRVRDVQDNSSTVEVVETASGKSIRRDQVVILPEALTYEGSIGAPPAPTARAVWDRSGGQDEAQTFVSVATMLVRLEGERRYHTEATRLVESSVGAALANDGRVDVIVRVDMDRLVRDRRLNARAEGRAGANVERGMDVSAYLLHGEVMVDQSTTQPRVSYEGRSAASGPATTRLNAVGSYRLTHLDGELVASVRVQVSHAGSYANRADIDAVLNKVAEAGARAVLARLFPITIEAVDADGTVWINAGAQAGIERGTRLNAYRPGREITDPTTGRSRGSTRQLIGELVVRDVQDLLSSARPARGTLSLSPSDVVEIINTPARGAASPARASAPPSAEAPAQENTQPQPVPY